MQHPYLILILSPKSNGVMLMCGIYCLQMHSGVPVEGARRLGLLLFISSFNALFHAFVKRIGSHNFIQICALKTVSVTGLY